MYILSGMTWITAVPLTKWRWWKWWRPFIPWLMEIWRLNNRKRGLNSVLKFFCYFCFTGGAKGRNRGESFEACGEALQDDWHWRRWQPYSNGISQGRWWEWWCWTCDCSGLPSRPRVDGEARQDCCVQPAPNSLPGFLLLVLSVHKEWVCEVKKASLMHRKYGMKLREILWPLRGRFKNWSHNLNLSPGATASGWKFIFGSVFLFEYIKP